ncbi:zinc finger protein 407 isoform X6 [Scyliorhinus canicula]|uniref:zinc finger protein 407 isoform X6 n=1 Tax=Scyliorhinus canicula TaxID=7830 RepID=UPI0018F6A155|nr:zinc finger protein 407 isoform X6 [Scyliorhinus canicula]
MDLNKEPDLVELPANEGRNGVGVPALGRSPQPGPARRCRRKAAAEPGDGKDPRAKGALEGKAARGGAEGGEGPCGGPPPAKRQRRDTLEQARGSRNVGTADGSALAPEEKPARAVTRHVQNDLKKVSAQLEGKPRDCQHRTKKIKVGGAWACPSCNFTKKNDTALKTDTNQRHSNDSYFVCDICNVTSSSKVNYRKHISSVLHKKQAKSISKDTSTKEGFNCRLCGRLLPSRYDLDKHIKENHSKRSKAHICPHCKFKAESAASLQAHLKHKHVREERLSCDLCGYQCYDENLLKTHCRGKTHLRRKNLAARGGYIHLLSKKGLSGEYDAKDKTESVKHLNKRSENLRTARNKGLAQKNAKGAKGLDKSTTTSKDLCVETVMGDEMPKANEQTELNNCSAGKATSRRTLRRVKEATDLPQVNRRLRRSAKGNNVSLRLRSARHNDDSEQSQSTRNRFSMEETGNRRSPRKLRGRANLLAMDDRRNRGRFPPRGEGFPEVKRSRGRIPGSKDHGVKPVSKTTAQISDHPEGKPEEQGRSSDANPSIANQEGENVVKVSCSGGTQEGESAPSEVPSPSSLVEKSAHSSSGNQNRDSPPANLPNNKAPKADNPESKLSPADREALRTCSYCGHLFQNRKGLEVHIKRRHTKEMVFHCQPCGYACVTKGDFEKHCQSNRHQTNFSNIDWLCSFVTSHDETLKDHVSQEPKAASYSQPGKPQPVSEEEPVDQGDTEHQIENIPPQEKESPAEQNQRLQLRGQELNKISSSGANVGPTVPKANPLFKDPQKPSIARVVAGNILRRSTHCRPQLQCKNCFYKARSATVLFKHIRLRHAQEYRFYCTVCSLYTISKEAMEKHIKRSRHIENAKKRNLGPSVEECVEEVSVGVQDVQKTMKAPGALGNVNTEIDKGCVQVLEPSKPKEEFVVTWEISEGDASSVENVQKSSDLQSAESSKRGRPKGNISRTCSYCGLLASSVTNLNIHIRRKHSHQYSYFCKACNYYTVTKGDMDRHCNTKKHKNRADVSKAVEVCRKIAAPPDKGNPQVIENDAVALSTAGGVESGSEAMEPEAPDVENPSRSTENCTRVNLEGHLSAQNQQKAENQNEVVVVLDVESNETAKDDSSSNCKQLKESHATTCAHCGFVAYSLATLELHVKRKHTKDFDYYCMACDYYAVTRREMMRHAFTEKHKLKSQAYVRLNLDKGHDTSTTIADAPGNGNQKEGSEDQMDKGSWNEEDEASKVAQDAAQEFALHVIESEKASGSHEQASASKQTAAVFEMAEKQDKCLQSEVTEEVDDSQTLPAVCHSEISPEADSGLLEANTSLSNASLDTESHPAELISMPVKSAVLETTQNQISEALIEEDSCRCCADIVTPQENDVSNNNIGLRAEASQTEVDDFQQLSQEDECQKDEQDVKLAEVAKEESPNLDSALNETVNPGESQPNTSGLAGGKEVQIECSPPVEDVEGSAVEDVEGSAVEDVEGSAVEDVEGSAVEDVEGSAVEDVEGSAVEDVEGSAAEDVEGCAVEDVEGSAVEDVEGSAVEDVEGSAAEDVEGSAVEDVEGSAVEDVEGSAVEDVEGSAVEDVEGSAVEDVEGSAVEDVEGSAVEGSAVEDVEGSAVEDVEVEDVEGSAAEDVEGSAGEDVEGSAGEDVEGSAVEDVEGSAVEDVEGSAVEDVEGSAVEDVEDVEGSAVEDVEGSAVEDVEGSAVEGSAVEDVEGSAVEDVEVEDVEGSAVEDVEGSAGEDVEGSAVEDVEGSAVEDVEGSAVEDVEDVEGSAVEDVEGSAVEDVEGSAVEDVEDVEGSAVEDVEGSAVEDVEGSAVEDVEGSAVEGSAVEDVEGSAVEDVEGSAVEDVEGSAVEAGHDQQPGKNSEHIRINLAQQIDNNFEGVLETTTAEESVQGDADPPQDVRVDEALLDAQNKMEAALKEKNWNSKSANEMSQETESDALEVTESTGDGFAKLDSQGKGWQKHFEFDASIVRLKKKSWSEKSECTDNSEDSQGTDGISSNEWAVAVYKTDPSQVTRKRKTEGSLLQDSKRIRCEDCGFLADGVNGLNVHIAMKHPSAEKHFHCFLCGKSFYTESNLHQHLASVGHQRMEQESIEELPEGGATFKCVKCNTAFDSEQCLFVHIKQKHEEMVREVNKYIVEDTEQINCERQENQGNVCKYCGKVCKSSNSLAFLAHIRTHTGSKPFRCTLCNFATAQLGDARNHVKRHLGVREYKCHICGWAFVMKKHLSTHLLGKHGIGTPKERKFVCEICDRTFTEKWALTNHKKLHMGQKPFKCTWLTCHYSFLTASAMRDHFRTHTGEKSFLCDLCGFAGGTRHALTKHRRQHTGEKPFKCDQCHFASTTQSHLTRHRRVHTGEKPYMCPWCDYRSNCAENIRKHILHTGKHEGVKMYNCPKCEYGTNIPLEFRNHLKEYHPDIENPDLAYLHAGIVSKAYECRLKGQGAQFVETAVPFNTPQSTDCADVTDNALNDCSEQQEPTESIGQVIIIQGYQVGCGEDISIDASVEATAAATLQTLAMAGQMAQVAQVMHITEDGQLIATTQSAAHVGSMVPGQILTRQLTSGATQVVVVENRTEEGGVTEAAVALETLADSSHVIEQVVTQEESTVPASETPTALDALLCAVTELGEVEARSAEQEGSEPTQEESCVVSSAIEEVISAPKESICGAMEMFHKEETGHEARQTEAAEPGEMVSNIEQPMSVTTAGEESQVAFSDMVQEVLQFTMCDMRTTSHIVKDGITQVIVAKEGTAHMVEGGSQIIMQEGEEQTITTHGRPMRLVDSSGKISQIIITNEILQAMVQETGSDLSEETTHVIVTEVPHTVVNGDHTRAVTEVYPHSVMELISEDMSSSTHPVTTIALAECYTEDRSEIVMTELSAKEEQEMEVGGIQEA